MKPFTIQLDDEQQYQKLLELARQAGIEVVGEAQGAGPSITGCE